MLRRIMVLVSDTAIENAFWRITIICRRNSLLKLAEQLFLSEFGKKHISIIQPLGSQRKVGYMYRQGLPKLHSFTYTQLLSYSETEVLA